MEPVQVASPCNSVCKLNVDDVCIGCGRSLDEIANWSVMDNGARKEALALAVERRKLLE